MKRDKELIRKLLIEIESSDKIEGLKLDSRFTYERYGNESIVGFGPRETQPELRNRDYQLIKMAEAGLVKFKGSEKFQPEFKGGYVQLTNAGHDAIEAISDEELWKKLKSAAPKEAYDLIKGIASPAAVAAISTLMGWG